MMDNGTVRIVFYVDSVGEVEKVLETATEPCTECGGKKERVLASAEIEALGYQAGQAINDYTHGGWYNGLIKGLLAGGGCTVTRLAVEQRTEDIRTALSVYDAAH